MMRILWIRNPNTALKTPFLPKHRAKNCLRQKSLRILYCSIIHCIGTLSTVSSANDKNWPTYYNHFWLCKIFKRNDVFRCPQGYMLWTAVHTVTCYEQLSTLLHVINSCPHCYMLWTAVHTFTWNGQLSTMLHGMDSCPPGYILWTAVHTVTCYKQLSTLLHVMNSCPHFYMEWTAVHNVTWYGQLSTRLYLMNSCPHCYML